MIFPSRSLFIFKKRRTAAKTHLRMDSLSGWFCLVNWTKTVFSVFSDKWVGKLTKWKQKFLRSDAEGEFWNQVTQL